MFNKHFLILLIFINLFGLIFVYSSALAEGGQASGKQSDTVTLTNPLCSDPNNPNCVGVPEILGRVIEAALGIVGSIALIMFIYGGFMWLTSAGNATMVDKGRDAMIWAAIGLGVIFGAYALVHFVLINAILGK